jgi:3-oxoacyl-[acyl-carrier-protein] synthase II
MKKRVAVTGIGVVSSIGVGAEMFWGQLIAGKSGISRVSLFDTSRFKRHYAGEVKRFSAEKYVSPRIMPFVGRASQFAIAATSLALRDASLSKALARTMRPAVIIGVTIPEGNAVDTCSELLLNRRHRKVTKESLLNIFSPSIARDVGCYFGFENINCLIPNACAAGNYAIGYGFDAIRNEEADIAVVGGSEALSRIAFQGFQSLNSMAPRECTPFAQGRKGMILGEGSGILILEPLDRAKKRKAKIYAEVLGYGASCDAHHMTIPSKHGVLSAMAKALSNSRIATDEVDYISAHGTGTPANDKNESAAVKELFKNRKVPVSSIKSMLGHCMGAASSIEAIACCLAIRDSIVPPTINFNTPDPECDIDCVPNKARNIKVKIALNNGFAFGGNNCCTVFRQPRD